MLRISVEMFFEKNEGIDTKPVEIFPGHTGVAGSSPIFVARPDFEMEVIRSAEVRFFQFFPVEESGEGSIRIDPIPLFYVYFFHMGVDGIDRRSVRIMMFNDNCFVWELAKNMDHPAPSDGKDSFFKFSGEIDPGMKVSRLVAAAEVTVSTDESAFEEFEIFPVGIKEW